MQLDHLDPKVLGQRLTDARKARDVTQEAAAKHLGCSRPTLIAVEKGLRSPKPEEIVALASLYGRKVHELVRPGEPLADLQPHLRAVGQAQASLARASNWKYASVFISWITMIHLFRYARLTAC